MPLGYYARHDFNISHAILGTPRCKFTVSVLNKLFKQAGKSIPQILANWENQINIWCNEYYDAFSDAEISEVNLDFALYLFDHTAERVTLAYALSAHQLMKRDVSRMHGFPNVNVSVSKKLGESAFFADKGHFLGHASGGILDINLFPQRRELNRGWSDQGKIFRRMERYVAEHTGTFFYHRPLYDDKTWIPARLEYGVLIGDNNWWINVFQNK